MPSPDDPIVQPANAPRGQDAVDRIYTEAEFITARMQAPLPVPMLDGLGVLTYYPWIDAGTTLPHLSVAIEGGISITRVFQPGVTAELFAGRGRARFGLLDEVEVFLGWQVGQWSGTFRLSELGFTPLTDSPTLNASHLAVGGRALIMHMIDPLPFNLSFTGAAKIPFHTEDDLLSNRGIDLSIAFNADLTPVDNLTTFATFGLTWAGDARTDFFVGQQPAEWLITAALGASYAIVPELSAIAQVIYHTAYRGPQDSIGFYLGARGGVRLDDTGTMFTGTLTLGYLPAGGSDFTIVVDIGILVW